MKIGMMNNPQISLPKEIKKAAYYKFDFMDLTLEPPRASSWKIDVNRIMEMLMMHKIPIVGHTAYYLPVSHVYEKVQNASIEELKHDIATFNTLGAKKVTLHYNFFNPIQFFQERDIIRVWSRALSALVPFAGKQGIQLVLEHFVIDSRTFTIFDELFRQFEPLGFHLDVGHANLGAEINCTQKLLERYGNRLSHVHMSDNKGGSSDLHLPLYCGTINWEEIIRMLKAAKYNGTITLEVFTNRLEYLLLSRDILRNLWEKN